VLRAAKAAKAARGEGGLSGAFSIPSNALDLGSSGDRSPSNYLIFPALKDLIRDQLAACHFYGKWINLKFKPSLNIWRR
jgi:hypothetical protein